ncbi:MAG: glycosyltransferase family 4 protein [Deltaproteobacteria bacterium]|nr:glycosyltransferase family 4 protein [Deltaproteobacteria bacterium]
MRIGLIRMRYTPFGGAEVFLQRFMDELLKRGHSLEVFSTNWEEKGRLKVHKVKAAGPSFLRPLTFALNAEKEVDKSGLDCVISLERTFCQDIYRAGDGCHREWLIRRGRSVSGLKRFLIRLNPLHSVLLHIEKRLFSSKRLKKVVANSNQVKQDIIRHYGLPDEKICVIYNGIDLSSFNAPAGDERERFRTGLGINPDTIMLLFVGSGFERKGLMYAIRALGLLKEKGDFRLLVVGKGKASKYIEEAKSLGVLDRVIFKGPVKGTAGYYGAADIFILPTIYEPFSNACLEAMASGLPVVTSRVNGASEVLQNGVNAGIIEDPADHAEVAEKTLLFLDKDKRLKAGRLSRQAAEKYPIEKNVSEFLKVVEAIRK